MKMRILGKTGIGVSEIGFGGIPIQRISEEQAGRIIKECVDSGINFFDTARVYTDSEEKIGRGLSRNKIDRDKVYIASKAKVITGNDMKIELEKSLNMLGTDYIDLYQIHAVGSKEQLETIFSEDGAIGYLKIARKHGLIRHIGITGHKPKILEVAVKSGEFDTVQFPFNFIEYKTFLKLLNSAQELKVGTIIMKPLAGGALKNIESALRFILSYPVSVVIPGMDSIEQVRQNVSVEGSIGHFPESDVVLLEKERDSIGKEFCRQCQYCMPCPKGIDISSILCLDAYNERYGLVDWAKKRYKHAIHRKANLCVECGLCESKCPYELPIRKKLRKAHESLS
ncbi:aldo/keto reductase [Candidatus Woesearchaeota archaeon]|nr:aldo/keto reductase [Candidatus Woesearchaeota archaeon]